MARQQVLQAHQKQPFEPFRIVTGDGRFYDVRHPENLAVTGNGRIVLVAMHDYAATLDTPLITAIQQPIPKRNGTRRKS